MGDPSNPARIREVWNPARIADQLREIDAVRHLVTLSGGWAWHFLSPPHEEFKILHDHSDIDLFVNDLIPFRGILIASGFERVKTKYDDGKFYRFRKFSWNGKIVIDAFLGSPPSLKVGAYTVVQPSHLLGFYGNIHQSDSCVAVQAAKDLLGQGVQGHPNLIRMP